jgi:acid phosphatase type 7
MTADTLSLALRSRRPRETARRRGARLEWAAALVLVWLTAFSAQAVAQPRAPVIAAAGDIACDPADQAFNDGLGVARACRQLATSKLLIGQNLAAVLPLGDVQYECAGYDAFERSYAASWGHLKSITHPVPGNHEYQSSGGTNCDFAGSASGYFRYFGAAAGDPSTGYYSYNLGGWHLIALNSNCANAGGCEAGSPQEQWLRNDLAGDRAACTLAYWHHPRYTSGLFRPGFSQMAPMYKDLYDYHADVLLAGHDHLYERFAPQAEAGRLDRVNGVRSFVVGTGGDDLFRMGRPIANSEVGVAAFGVLVLTLRAGAYDWRFIDVTGRVRDSGSDRCDRGAPNGLAVSLPSAGRVPTRVAAQAALARRLLVRYPSYNAYFTDCRHRTRTRFRCTWRVVGRRLTRVVAGSARAVRRPHRWRVAIYPFCRDRPRCMRYGS